MQLSTCQSIKWLNILWIQLSCICHEAGIGPSFLKWIYSVKSSNSILWRLECISGFMAYFFCFTISLWLPFISNLKGLNFHDYRKIFNFKYKNLCSYLMIFQPIVKVYQVEWIHLQVNSVDWLSSFCQPMLMKFISYHCFQWRVLCWKNTKCVFLHIYVKQKCF